MLRFLIEIICTLYLIRLLVRWISSLLFPSAANNTQYQQQYYRQQQQQQQNQQQRQREGTIKIDHMPEKKKSSVPDNEGDFVDYEEIK